MSIMKINKFEYDPDMGAYIVITNNKAGEISGFFYIDEADLGLVKNNKYSLAAKTFYPRRHAQALHHDIIGKKKGMVVDHINQNVLDNRRQNLRHVSHGFNAINSNKVNAKSGLKGVNEYKPEKWRASAWDNGKSVHLGTFKTKEDAKKARAEYIKNKYNHIESV